MFTIMAMIGIFNKYFLGEGNMYLVLMLVFITLTMIIGLMGTFYTVSSTLGRLECSNRRLGAVLSSKRELSKRIKRTRYNIDGDI